MTLCPMLVGVIGRALVTLARSTSLVRAGLVAAAVATAFSYPVAVLAGWSVKSGADALEALPRQLTIRPFAQTTSVYAADGRTPITDFYEENRSVVPLAAISPWMQEAMIAAEDARFFVHHGVDFKGALRAFVANQQAGGVSQGASTLTMQYIRNMLRDQAETPQQAVDATVQNGPRKVREMKLAIEMEKRVSKADILEGYLNLAYFGHHAYGVAAASSMYFSTTPAALTLAQAALLAGLVQAPSGYDPAADPAAATQRR